MTKQTDKVMTPGEVARVFRVDPKTVSRWAAAGRLRYFRTMGGHRRFYEADVRALVNGGNLVPEQRANNQELRQAG